MYKTELLTKTLFLLLLLLLYIKKKIIAKISYIVIYWYVTSYNMKLYFSSVATKIYKIIFTDN